MNEPYPALARGSQKWLEYANLLTDCTVEDLRESQARFRANRMEQKGREDGYAVAYTDMQLGCIADALVSRESGATGQRD
jgi:hypothetical protein